MTIPAAAAGSTRRRHAGGGSTPVSRAGSCGDTSSSLGSRARRGRADVSTRPPRAGSLARTSSRASSSAVPLLAVYFGLAALYAWQASRRPVPTIFTDELELTQLARAIAETGEPARRGEPYGGSQRSSHTCSHRSGGSGRRRRRGRQRSSILVLAMTATVFPAYGLARMVVPKWYALAAAGAAVAVPALAYSPFLVEEPLAYPLSTLALWLIARSLERPTWGRIAAAGGACVVAAGHARSSSILFMVFALGLLWLGWQSERVRRWRGRVERWDWAGAIALAVGRRARVLRCDGPCLDRVARDDVRLQGPHRRARGLGDGRARDRHRSPPGARGSRGARAAEVGERPDPRTRAVVVTSVAALVVFLAVRGRQGRVQLDGLLARSSSSGTSSISARSSSRDGARVRAWRRPRAGRSPARRSSR